MPTDMKGLCDRLELAAMAYERLGKLTRDDEKTRAIRKDAIAELAAARAAILAYEAAKPKEAEGQPVQKMHTLDLKLGSRLTVEGVEAVVVPVQALEPFLYYGMGIGSDCYQVRVTNVQLHRLRAMLSAAGDRQ